MQALLEVDAELELEALRNIEPVQLIMEYPSQPSVVLFICVNMREEAFMTGWSFSVHFLGAPAIRQLQ